MLDLAKAQQPLEILCQRWGETRSSSTTIFHIKLPSPQSTLLRVSASLRCVPTHRYWSLVILAISFPAYKPKIVSNTNVHLWTTTEEWLITFLWKLDLVCYMENCKHWRWSFKMFYREYFQEAILWGPLKELQKAHKCKNSILLVSLLLFVSFVLYRDMVSWLCSN